MTKDQVRSTEEAFSTERALDLALEVLKAAYVPADLDEQREKAITAIKQARALDKKAAVVEPHKNARELGLDYEPAPQEPVAWMYPDDHERMLTNETFCTVYSVEVGSATRGESTVPLYTSPPAQRPVAEPHKWVHAAEWRGLTDEEIEQGCKESWVTEQAWQSAVWWAEAKLRSKNT